MRLQRKLFSKKEDFKDNAETDRQKKRRKGAAMTLVGGGAALGAELGAFNANELVSDKANRVILKAKLKHTDHLLKVNDVIRKTKNKVKSQDIPAYIKLLEKVQDKLDHEKNTIEKASKSANKIVKRSTIKGGLKGAAIGTGIGVGLGYLANKSIKKQNKEINKARRNKK